MTITALDTWGGASPGTSDQTSASLSPTGTFAVYVAAAVKRFSAAPSTPTISDGLTGVTWVQLEDVLFDTSGHQQRLTVWGAIMPASPGSGTITIGVGGEDNDYVRVLCFETDLPDVSGTVANTLKQSKRGSVDSAATSEAVTLDSTPTDAVFGVFASEQSESAGTTPGTGFTEINETPRSGSTNGDIQSEYDLTPADAVVDASWTVSSQHGAFVWEVNPPSAGGGQPPRSMHQFRTRRAA